MGGGRFPWVPAALAAYSAYVLEGLKTPLPGEDQDVAEGLAVERFEFATADGLTLRGKRYANPGATPVLLVHGFGGNGFCFDLPRLGRNMAVHLARAGFDVWVPSLRCCGRPPYASDAGDWSHSMDELAVYDCPALVDGVISATGRRVFWIGHSMGGFLLYMYLQGALLERDGTVVVDTLLSARRHERLLGGLTMGAPTVFSWPVDDPERKGTNTFLADRMIRSFLGTMRAKEQTSPRVARAWRRPEFRDRHPRMVAALSRSPLVARSYNRANTDRDTTTSLAIWASDDVSAAMWVQRLESLMAGDLVQHPTRDGSPGHDYAEAMPMITLPLMFVTGQEDFSPRGVEATYRTVSSGTREFVKLDGYGHIDLLIGRNVSRDLYPIVCGWINRVEREAVAAGGPDALTAEGA